MFPKNTCQGIRPLPLVPKFNLGTREEFTIFHKTTNKQENPMPFVGKWSEWLEFLLFLILIWIQLKTSNYHIYNNPSTF